MTSFEIDDDVRAALHEWKERDGINVSEQLRRAIRAWLEEHGKLPKGGAQKRKTARK